MFQGFYKSILVQKETHLLELSRYVVLNPVRPGLVVYPADGPWSNYRAAAGLDTAPEFLNVQWTLSQFENEIKKQVNTLLFVAGGLKVALGKNCVTA